MTVGRFVVWAAALLMVGLVVYFLWALPALERLGLHLDQLPIGQARSDLRRVVRSSGGLMVAAGIGLILSGPHDLVSIVPLLAVGLFLGCCAHLLLPMPPDE